MRGLTRREEEGAGSSRRCAAWGSCSPRRRTRRSRCRPRLPGGPRGPLRRRPASSRCGPVTAEGSNVEGGGLWG
eukprot:1742350-Pyramimonas_sp.AAC.1